MVVRSRRKRYDSEVDFTKDAEINSKILLKDIYKLLNWSDEITIRTPYLFVPTLIADYVASLPFCKIAISPKADRVALMSHSRQLSIYKVEGESATQECCVQVLEDEFSEYCLLEFSASGSLILSTRSSAQIDVFNQTGGYCYDIPLELSQQGTDLMCAISCIHTEVNQSSSSDEKYVDVLYVLQYNATFSVYKIGRLARFYKMWSLSLGIPSAASFSISHNLLFVSSQYRISHEVKPPGGLCTFRLLDREPYIDIIHIVDEEGGWLSRLPFSSAKYVFLSSMSINAASTLLASVSTNGDFYLFDLPSTRVSLHYKYISGPKPLQTVFLDQDEVGVLFNTGTFLRCSPVDLRESLHSHKATEYEKFPTRTRLVAPCSRQLFILAGEDGSVALKEVATQRTSFAFRMWIDTIWGSFKQLVGMAAGDAAAPLQRATHTEMLEFTLWHAPTNTLQQLLERYLNGRDYTKAKNLAESHKSIDRDVILKSEWRDVCRSGQVTVDHVRLILHQIKDADWRMEECCSSQAESREVQKALIDLGTSLDSAPIASRIRVHHRARLLAVCDEVDLYLAVREKSCLEAAVYFAQRSDLVSLERLLVQNSSVLRPLLLLILSHIPASIPPTRYSPLLPRKDGRESFDKSPNVNAEWLKKIAKENSEAKELVSTYNTGGVDTESVNIDMCRWALERARLIDADCGLVEHSILLIKVVVEKGYKELEPEIERWHYFGSFVEMCSLINENIEIFEQLTVNGVLDSVTRLTEKELVKHASSIIALVKYKSGCKDEGKLREILKPLLISATEKTTKVMMAFKKQQDGLVNMDLVVECLGHMETTGVDLLRAVTDFEVSSDLASALSLFHSRAVKPTFKLLWDSRKELDSARRLLIRMAGCGQAETAAEWSALREDVIHLTEGLYSNLISTEEALELLASEVLSHEHALRDSELMQLFFTLDKNGKKDSDRLRLGTKKSAEVLLRKSKEMMQEAVERDDPLLSRARFLATTAHDIASEDSAAQLRLLDTVELAQELGCPMMPVAISLTDPNILLQDIVRIGNNYKQEKKCTELAELLEVDTPVATALSLCALSASEANDEEYLSIYIQEMCMLKVRNLAVVHQLCVKIIESSYTPASMEDIYACALINSPHEELLVSMKLIDLSRRSSLKKSGLKPVPSEKMVLDEMYVQVGKWQSSEPVESNIAEALECSNEFNGSDLATLLAYRSSSAALLVALSEKKEKRRTWTKSDKLMRYQEAVEFFEDSLNGRQLEAMPPSLLIALAGNLDETITPLDRIAHHGCDRVRFVEDAEYRTETIIGLAMTEDDAVFADALALSAEFKMDDWPVHMASLENAMTTLSPEETNRVLNSRSHLSHLQTRPREFHAALRSTVLPLIDKIAQFIEYLKLFMDTEPEKKVIVTFEKIVKRMKGINVKKMFTDVDYLSGQIVQMPDNVIKSIVDDLLIIPIGPHACDAASRVLLDGTDMRPASSPLIIYDLLGKNEAAFMDLIACKKLSEEHEYLKRSMMFLEADPKASSELLNVVKDRLAILDSSPSENENISSMVFSPEHTAISRRRR